MLTSDGGHTPASSVNRQGLLATPPPHSLPSLLQMHDSIQSTLILWALSLLLKDTVTYLLTCIDLFTHWPEAFLLQFITAEAVACTFVQGWISRFGVPATIVTDHGRQFESALWKYLVLFLDSSRT